MVMCRSARLALDGRGKSSQVLTELCGENKVVVVVANESFRSVLAGENGPSESRESSKMLSVRNNLCS